MFLTSQYSFRTQTATMLFSIHNTDLKVVTMAARNQYYKTSFTAIDSVAKFRCRNFELKQKSFVKLVSSFSFFGFKWSSHL